jgi:cobalt-zinc-cadmium resistance protein CzcA
MGNIVVTQRDGTPILVSDLGKLKLGIQERHGILGVDDRNDAIEGGLLLLRGENPSRVMEAVHAKVAEHPDGLRREVLIRHPGGLCPARRR